MCVHISTYTGMHTQIHIYIHLVSWQRNSSTCIWRLPPVSQAHYLYRFFPLVWITVVNIFVLFLLFPLPINYHTHPTYPHNTQTYSHMIKIFVDRDLTSNWIMYINSPLWIFSFGLPSSRSSSLFHLPLRCHFPLRPACGLRRNWVRWRWGGEAKASRFPWQEQRWQRAMSQKLLRRGLGQLAKGLGGRLESFG